MRSLSGNLAVLLLFLSASPLLHSRLFTHASSVSPPATRSRIMFVTGLSSDDNYDDDDYLDTHTPSPDVVRSVKTTFLQQEPQTLCQYNPCLENQEPCSQIALRTGCLCPGVSGADEPPHAPRIQELLPVRRGEDRGKVEVKWCAPSSVVSGYRVVIEGSEALDLGDTLRQSLVGSLEVGTKVCVEAVNSAGHSIPSEFSCTRYDPPAESTDHKLLAGIIGGGVALLLLLIIGAVILWKHQMRKKANRDSADGLGNPSYSTEGTL